MTKIQWEKEKPDASIIDLLGLKIKSPPTLADALKNFSKNLPSPNHFRKWMFDDILKSIDPKKKISDVNIADGAKAYAEMLKHSSNPDYGKKVQSTIGSIIIHACTGKLPEANGASQNGHVNGITAIGATPSDSPFGRLKFSKAKIADILHLVGSRNDGKFGPVKEEVRKTIHSTPAGEAGIIQLPKNLSMKEAVALRGCVSGLLAKEQLPWVSRFNKTQFILILIRREDYKAMIKKR